MGKSGYVALIVILTGLVGGILFVHTFEAGALYSTGKGAIACSIITLVIWIITHLCATEEMSKLLSFYHSNQPKAQNINQRWINSADEYNKKLSELYAYNYNPLTAGFVPKVPEYLKYVNTRTGEFTDSVPVAVSAKKY